MNIICLKMRGAEVISGKILICFKSLTTYNLTCNLKNSAHAQDTEKEARPHTTGKISAHFYIVKNQNTFFRPAVLVVFLWRYVLD